MPSYIDYYNYSYPELVELFTEDIKEPELSQLQEHDLRTLLSEFKKRGIKELAYLLKRLRKKKSIIHYARELKVSEDYLENLKNWLQSLVPRARPLKDIPIVTTEHYEYLAGLKSLGITNTYDLLHKAHHEEGRKNLSNLLSIPIEFIDSLVKYADLFRLYGMSSRNAQILVENGIDSLHKIIEVNPVDLPVEYAIQYKKEANRSIKRLQVVW
jgi:hypothetical protein